MNSTHTDDETMYIVVVNHEEQFSIWPAHRDRPPGWNAVGTERRKAECLAYIESVWKDVRPLSARQNMDVLGVPSDHTKPLDLFPSLVEQLVVGRYPIEAALLHEDTAATLKVCIERGLIPIRFPQTRGGTQLVLKLDPTTISELRLVDFNHLMGTVHLEGELMLDGARLKCVVDLNAATLSGEATLVRREADEGET